MTVVVAAEGLSKRYRIGQHKAAYGTLRDSVVQQFRRFQASWLKKME